MAPHSNSPSAGEGPASSGAELHCPFCGQAVSERLRVEDKLVLIFPCMFSPVLDASLPPEEVRRQLERFRSEGSGYFQAQCDRLHYFVTKGAGAVLPPSGAGRAQGPG